MNALCLYIQKLLNYPPEMVITADENFDPALVTGGYIVVNEISGTPKGYLIEYDEVTETEYRTVCMESRCEILFYGDNAEANAKRFMAMQGSQCADDIQRELSVAFYRSTKLSRVKEESGIYLWKADIVCDYTHMESVECLRIDIAQLELLADKK